MDIISEFIRRANDEKQLLEETVSTGSVINFEQYQRLVGRREGLVYALDILNEVLAGDEDDNEQ